MTAESIRLASEQRMASERRTRTIGTTAQLVDYQEVAVAHLGEQPLPLSKYLKNSSSIEMGIDGTTPANFDLSPSGSEIYRIEKLVLLMVLSSSPTMLQLGNLAAGATGLSLKVLNNDLTVITDLLDGQLLLSNNDLAAHGEVTLHELGLSYTLKTVITPISPIRLEVPTAGAEILRMTVSKDLSTITRMRCLAIGRQEDITT